MIARNLYEMNGDVQIEEQLTAPLEVFFFNAFKYNIHLTFSIQFSFRLLPNDVTWIDHNVKVLVLGYFRIFAKF